MAVYDSIKHASPYKNMAPLLGLGISLLTGSLALGTNGHAQGYSAGQKTAQHQGVNLKQKFLHMTLNEILTNFFVEGKTLIAIKEWSYGIDKVQPIEYKAHVTVFSDVDCDKALDIRIDFPIISDRKKIFSDNAQPAEVIDKMMKHFKPESSRALLRLQKDLKYFSEPQQLDGPIEWQRSYPLWINNYTKEMSNLDTLGNTDTLKIRFAKQLIDDQKGIDEHTRRYAVGHTVLKIPPQVITIDRCQTS